MRLNEFSDISFVVCLLTITPAVTSAQWMELNRPHYSIFYQAGFDADARLVRQ
jgi:hypothetical protein